MLSCPRCFRRCYPRSPSGTEPLVMRCTSCGASQTFAWAKAGWKRQGPYTLACGCDSTGKGCEESEQIYAPIAEHYRRIAAGQNSDDDLTAARAAYRAHFD